MAIEIIHMDNVSRYKGLNNNVCSVCLLKLSVLTICEFQWIAV